MQRDASGGHRNGRIDVIDAIDEKTDPERAMTLIELHDRLAARIDASSRMLFNEIEAVKGTLRVQEERIIKLERGQSTGLIAAAILAAPLLHVLMHAIAAGVGRG